jgi:integrase
MTKNGKAHTLPVTPLMREMLERRCEGLEPEQELFARVSAEHLARAAMVVGAPRFMLHDLRKMLATVGQKVGIGDAVLRRILNHTPARADVLHRHYVALSAEDLVKPMIEIQQRLVELMRGA